MRSPTGPQRRAAPASAARAVSAGVIPLQAPAGVAQRQIRAFAEPESPCTIASSLQDTRTEPARSPSMAGDHGVARITRRPMESPMRTHRGTVEPRQGTGASAAPAGRAGAIAARSPRAVRGRAFVARRPASRTSEPWRARGDRAADLAAGVTALAPDRCDSPPHLMKI